MDKISKILLLPFLLFTVLISCKKASVDKYPKNSIVLKTSLLNGTEIITWDKINTSDFVKYEIFASADSVFDLNSKTKIVSTTTDVEKNFFETSNVILDSINNGAKIYFKVTAVLSNRKLASNTISTTNSILFAKSNYTFVGAIPELNKIFVSDQNTFGKIEIFDVEKLTLTPLDNVFFNSNGVLNYGKNSNGDYRIIIYNGNGIQIVNVETNNIEHIFTESSANSVALINGFILVNVFSSAQGQYIVEVHRENDYSLASTFTLLNGSSTDFIVCSDNTRFCVRGSFGQSEMFSISSNGIVSQLSAGNISNNGGNLLMNTNGTMLVTGFQGLMYNTNFQQIASLTNVSSLNNYSFSQNNNYIVATNQSNNSCEIFDCTTFKSVKKIDLTFANAGSQIFNPFPVFINNTLYITGTFFNSVTSKLVIFKK